MASDSDTTTDHKIELKWAGFELIARQFEQYCEAWPHTKALCDRIPRDMSIWNEPANRFSTQGMSVPAPVPAGDRRR